MKRLRLFTTEHDHFQKAWQLYEDAFPIDEKRELGLQKEIIKNPKYHFDVIFDEDDFVGFLLWWEFESFRYIEHLATLSVHRGKGYGKQIVKQFISESEDVIILEVDLPKDEVSKRRINFYERIDFKLNQYPYKQLPLRKGGEYVDMLLMSSPQILSKQDVDRFKEQFKTECYEPYFLG
ncbi:GNAT family N-acetyltransferase [Sediminitomix flava]|uniref:Acetyltransferase (GNAT) family protein n=1 Tax=Sediminitomix flava TaxID=379075 RepID=A0A315ZU20_SEDFL|nr:GNAT family N-acetyltransferase [Sediminitomix flava]PWJ39179.1 acetyltransferase (GNAT) family protein [Sediminitomix flava]